MMIMAKNTETAPKYGALIQNAGGDVAEKADITKNVLGLNWYRSRVNAFSSPPNNAGSFPGWDGSANAWEDPRIIGLLQIMQINMYPPGSENPYVTAAHQAQFASIAEDIYDTYGDPNGIDDIEMVALDNEEQTDQYHSGPMSDYVNTLHTMWNVFHPKGVKTTDGGIIHGLAIKIKTYQWVDGKYGRPTADLFATSSAMTPHQIRYARGEDTDAGFDAMIADLNLILSARVWVDYFNFHYYRNAENGSVTDVSPYEIRFQKEMIEAVGKRPSISNEMGIRDNTQPLLVTNVMDEFYRLGVEYVQWWSGDGAGGDVSLTDPDGTIRPHGIAFRDWILAHKHREYYGPLP